jgi:hypothetical protein
MERLPSRDNQGVVLIDRHLHEQVVQSMDIAD